MSHTITAQCSVTDEAAARRTCERLGHGFEKRQGIDAGVMIRLKGWHQPVNYDLKGGCSFDNYSPYYDDTHPEVKAGRRRVGEEGRWGDLAVKDNFETEYVLDVLAAQAEAEGHYAEIVREGAAKAEVLVYV